MKENIEQTLRIHYGVRECMIHERSEYLEVTCVGGDSEFVCIALQHICSTDKVKLLRNTKSSYVIGISF
jgi:hypothetical protein